MSQDGPGVVPESPGSARVFSGTRTGSLASAVWIWWLALGAWPALGPPVRAGGLVLACVAGAAFPVFRKRAGRLPLWPGHADERLLVLLPLALILNAFAAPHGGLTPRLSALTLWPLLGTGSYLAAEACLAVAASGFPFPVLARRASVGRRASAARVPLAALFAAAYFLWFFAGAALRIRAFAVDFWDLGSIGQAMANLARGRGFVSDDPAGFADPRYGGHLEGVFALLAPLLRWRYGDMAICALQIAAVLAAAWAMGRALERWTGRAAGFWAGYLGMALHPALAHPLWFDFHADVFAVLPLALMAWAWAAGRPRAFAGAWAGALACSEMSLVAACGFALMRAFAGWREHEGGWRERKGRRSHRPGEPASGTAGGQAEAEGPMGAERPAGADGPWPAAGLFAISAGLFFVIFIAIMPIFKSPGAATVAGNALAAAREALRSGRAGGGAPGAVVALLRQMFNPFHLADAAKALAVFPAAAWASPFLWSGAAPGFAKDLLCGMDLSTHHLAPTVPVLYAALGLAARRLPAERRAGVLAQAVLAALAAACLWGPSPASPQGRASLAAWAERARAAGGKLERVRAAFSPDRNRIVTGALGGVAYDAPALAFLGSTARDRMPSWADADVALELWDQPFTAWAPFGRVPGHLRQLPDRDGTWRWIASGVLCRPCATAPRPPGEEVWRGAPGEPGDPADARGRVVARGPVAAQDPADAPGPADADAVAKPSSTAARTVALSAFGVAFDPGFAYVLVLLAPDGEALPLGIRAPRDGWIGFKVRAALPAGPLRAQIRAAREIGGDLPPVRAWTVIAEKPFWAGARMPSARGETAPERSTEVTSGFSCPIRIARMEENPPAGAKRGGPGDRPKMGPSEPVRVR
jgi:hypothetical protein